MKNAKNTLYGLLTLAILFAGACYLSTSSNTENNSNVVTPSPTASATSTFTPTPFSTKVK